MLSPSVVSIGNFDGVHRGHQAILRRARELAQQHAVRLAVLTFDPHPASVLRPGSQPPRLTSLMDRLDLLKAAGVDETRVLEPTPQLLGQTAEMFVHRVVEEYRPVAIVEGKDFVFGKGRGGDMALLAQLGERHGFEAVSVPHERVVLSDRHEVPVSSSLIRWLVGRGRVRDAAAALGRPFSLRGMVVRGEGRGRKLEFPTANLDPEAYAELIAPADGVYAGTVVLPPRPDEPQPTCPAAISVGTKPTFGRQQLTIEAYLLDYQPARYDELYDQPLTFRFDRFLRDQWAFPDVQDLIQQMQRDVARVRQASRVAS